MERIKFLKFFIYLTDVTEHNGPHCFVNGSHKRQPRAILKDRRIIDEEVLNYYDQKDLIEITGSQGTIIAVDTRGLHKGKILESGDRLILQIEYAVSLFGVNLPKFEINPSVRSFL